MPQYVLIVMEIDTRYFFLEYRLVRISAKRYCHHLHGRYCLDIHGHEQPQDDYDIGASPQQSGVAHSR